MRLIADGLSNKEIGRALSISPFTVRVRFLAAARPGSEHADGRRGAGGEGRLLGRFHAAVPEFPRKHPRMPKREVCRDFPRSLLAALKPVAADQSHP
ncbi:LuxR C-terminal-related transcriptional regulator [Pseudomonas aeruginosa]|nr:LuxR C-terminal-related transcriptional regulator [Pseudomonas aeruginosa]